MAVVEAGVPLMEFYTAVEEAGLFFPPHPGDESAMIGGLIATNAGGARAVKYGVIRNYIRGLEVVLPSGKIIHPGGKLMKSSTGYNLLNLFIGSEGTLGIVTQATIQLMPPPAVFRSLIVPYDDLREAIETVPRLYEKIRPGADYKRSLDLLAYVNKNYPDIFLKSGLMLGMGEKKDEVLKVLSDLKESGCSAVTIGQYLRPGHWNIPVQEYVHPDIFKYYEKEAKEIGFLYVASGPYVRSSYMAHEGYRDMIKKK